MKITKLKIKNMFGIKELNLDGSDIEISGKNGVGKTSVIDSIRVALANKCGREIIINQGEKEGMVYLETDTGITLDRKNKTEKANSITIKENGELIRKTNEAFLRNLFTFMQLNPMEFLGMDAKEQNRVLLDLIEFKWDLNWIKDQFGEIVPDINYEQNILRVLYQIQSEQGYYFQKRQEINRDIRNNRAFIEEIGAALPKDYNANHWRKSNLSELYTKIEKIRAENRAIEKAIFLIRGVDDKIRAFDADKQIKISAIEKETASRRNQIEQTILKLKNQIKEYETETSNLEEKKLDKISVVDNQYHANIAEFKSQIEESKPLAEKKMSPIAGLVAEAENIESMKAHINEYDRMVDLLDTNVGLQLETELLTVKIEKARNLPAEILKTCKLPIENISIVDGEPLIKGLPLNNLSDGEKLSLCVDIACAKETSLSLLLIDGVEKLSKKNRENLYDKCKGKGVQIIATRTTDDDILTVIKL